MIVDLGLPDIDGVALIQKIKSMPRHERVPVIVYTGRELVADEEAALRRLSESVIIKDTMSPERLIDETNYFLNQVEARLPETKRPPGAGNGSTSLVGRKILITDDDTAQHLRTAHGIGRIPNERVHCGERGGSDQGARGARRYRTSS